MARPGASPIGAHVFVSRGLTASALPYAAQIGAEVLQVFVSNPRGWASAPGDPRIDEAFAGTCRDRRLRAFVHAPYLVNFGSPTERTRLQSVEAVRHSLRRGRRICAEGVVVHAGSAVDAGDLDVALARVREHLLPLLDGCEDDDPMLLIEPTAGGGRALAARVEELGPLFDALDRHPRLGVCLDTCHAFAAGHDLSAPGGLRATLDALVRTVGRGRLRLVHANDSKDELGSGRDRHANLGAGRIGTGPLGVNVFAELFRHPVARGVPVVVETPGPAEAHRRDLDLLRRLRDG